MLQSGVLLKEIDELHPRMLSEGGDSATKSRICALIFLISQMSQPALGGETGLRATAPFLADLLVEDLAEDGARLRKRVPELLDVLVADGRIMRIDDEYRLQTEEGRGVGEGLPSRLAAIRDDATRMNQLRSERLVAAVEAAVGGLKLTHGVSKTPRKIDLHWGQDEPAAAEGDVPVWIRDEWSVNESTVKTAAAEAGDKSPIVFVFLPKHEADQIKESLASFAAAEETLRRPTPQTDEGKAAQRAMRTRLATDDERLTSLFDEVVARARVFQGGGGELTTSRLRDAVETAANRSLIRLFPKFAIGRQRALGEGRHEGARWGARRARSGRPRRRADHEPGVQGSARGDQPGWHERRRAAEALRSAAVRLAEGRCQRRHPHAACRRQHPGRPGRQGPRRPKGAAADSDRQGHPLQGGRTAVGRSASRRQRPTRYALASRTSRGKRARRSRPSFSGSRTSPGAPAGHRRCPSHRTPTTWTPFWRSAATSGSVPSPTTTIA